MALTTCKECGKPVSSKAEKCPNCGVTIKVKTSGCAWLFLILVILGVVFTGMFANEFSRVRKASAVYETDHPDEVQNIAERLDAWSEAQKFVKNQLKSPATANFGDGMFGEQSAAKNATKLPDGSYMVKMWVDSQNAYGAMMRSDCVVHLKYDGGNQWSLAEPLEMAQRQ
ncbi:MAG TPA: zinc ribbon domain-containing protein [Opitutales bacterium]|jgi:hypothetical protein|nr:zinc ribbon domain-containing protein [Opitutales bacterium]